MWNLPLSERKFSENCSFPVFRKYNYVFFNQKLNLFHHKMKLFDIDQQKGCAKIILSEGKILLLDMKADK